MMTIKLLVMLAIRDDFLTFTRYLESITLLLALLEYAQAKISLGESAH